MKLEKKVSKVLLTLIVLASLLNGNVAEAGTVKIINNSDLNIMVDVISDPEWIPYCKTCFESRLQVCGKQTAEIIVPLDAFGGCSSFAMVDMVDGFMGSGKCKNLNVYKNYEITFSNTLLGTRCSCKTM